MTAVKRPGFWPARLSAPLEPAIGPQGRTLELRVELEDPQGRRVQGSLLEPDEAPVRYVGTRVESLDMELRETRVDDANSVIETKATVQLVEPESPAMIALER